MVLFECNAIYVKDVKDRSNIPKCCNAMYVRDVKDVKDRSNAPKGCNAMYVKDVKDRSNTPKGCNAMYVKDVEDGKEHTHTFWLITSLILNGFSIRKKFWKAETQGFPTIPSYPMYIKACRRIYLYMVSILHIYPVLCCL